MEADPRASVYRRVGLRTGRRPHYVVWELTLACDQRCTHCGSRAAEARPNELTTEKALDVVKQLAAMGTAEVTLIGGEAYLHPGFLDVVRAIAAAGMRPTMTSGGRGIDEALAKQMADAGLHSVSISVDGLEATHDLMRASRGGFAAATRALKALKAAGIRIASNMSVNRLNKGDLEGLYEHLRDLGVQSWQFALTAPLGRAADRSAMLLQPWDLLDVIPRIIALKKRAWVEARMAIHPAGNVGYFGPEETALRSPLPPQKDRWRGCQAGHTVLGIESDGAIKGCPSLQTDTYVGGNVKERSLQDIWDRAPELSALRQRTVEDLWGFCRTCPFAQACLGGCSYTAHSILGRPGNNPFCHYRARAFAERGLRERMVPREDAPGLPFDNGRFELVEEPFDAPDPQPALPRDLVRVRRQVS